MNEKNSNYEQKYLNYVKMVRVNHNLFPWEKLEVLSSNIPSPHYSCYLTTLIAM
jgi:hypothetical protein